MKKKIVLISIIMAIIIVVAAIFLYQTYATDPVPANDSYAVTLTGETTVTVPAGSIKKIIYQIKNTNKGTVNYAVGYSSQNNNVSVKKYDNSLDSASGTIALNSNKYITLGVINNSSVSATVNLSTILGYENGGNLIIPSGVTLVTEIIYNAADYITNLYTTAAKSTATVNSITYNLASSVNLMNDRHASMSTEIDEGDIRFYGANPYNYVWLGDTYISDYTIPGGISLLGYSDFQDCIDGEGYDEEEGALYCTEDTVRHTGDKKLWRIIGVFDGRIKLVSNDPISNTSLSWDTSADTVNSGWGINQWGESGNYEGSDLMRLLNPGYESAAVNNSLYWNKGTGTVYTGDNNTTTADVGFANTGLTTAEKNMIDTVTWYTGAYDQYSYVDAHYTAERGNMGKICSSGNFCNDDVTRTNTWSGKVGLINASDYGYAADLSQCNQTMNNYYNTGCVDTKWLKSNSTYWTMSPRADSDIATHVFSVADDGAFGRDDAGSGNVVRPAIYLKRGVIIDTNNNDGSYTYPYQLLLN